MDSTRPNRSKNRCRPAFTATYTTADVVPHEEANRWAVQCSGDAMRSIWKPNGRPDGIDSQ